MSICKNLEPKQVFHFFEELCNIPHGSGNTKKISDYCMEFARERGLFAHQDAYNNVIIKKDGTAGYEKSQPVILQGHMDMVCEKDADREIDFAKDGLELYVEGDFLKARGTTLGGDDGIAIAYAFALLDSDDIPHPPLEVVITVDEETGMLGAQAMDLSMIKGRRLLNIDSDEEGIFLTSCAGGIRTDCRIPVSYERVTGPCYELKVYGLLGGHSGTEIHKERANAIMTLGRVLASLAEEFDIKITGLWGGFMDNAIPREATAMLMVDAKQKDSFTDAVVRLESMLKKEYQLSDPGLAFMLTDQGIQEISALDACSTTKLLLFLRSVPYGVQSMSVAIPGLVDTSLNPGILTMDEKEFSLCFSIRSSVTSRKYEVTDRLRFLTEFLGGEFTVSGDYPAWEYKPDSELRELMRESYLAIYGEEPQIQAIHAGLECGILCGKLEGLDCISFGPNNFDIHTPQERLSISSTERVWKLVLEFLRRAK